MTEIAFVLSERSDDGQVDEVLAVCDHLAPLAVCLDGRLVDLWADQQGVLPPTDLMEEVRLVFSHARATPSVFIDLRHPGLDRSFRVRAAIKLPTR